jgi:hypothetical protein
VQNSSPRSILVSLLVSLLDTIYSMPRLFMGLSLSVLYSDTTSTPTLPLCAVSFLFILDLRPRCTLLANYFPLFSSIIFFLSQLFLHTSQLVFSSSLLGPFHTSPHLNNFMDPPQWIHLLAPFSPPFPKPPLVLGGLLNHYIRLHAHHLSLYEHHLDPKWNLFKHLFPWTFFKLSFNLTERIAIFYKKLNNVSFLHSSEPKINSPTLIFI